MSLRSRCCRRIDWQIKNACFPYRRLTFHNQVGEGLPVNRPEPEGARFFCVTRSATHAPPVDYGFPEIDAPG